MAPLKSSLSRSVSKLLGVSKDRDLSLRGASQTSRLGAQFRASGGTKIDATDGFTYHIFQKGNSDNFSITETTGSDTVEVLLIGGESPILDSGTFNKATSVSFVLI